MIITITGTPGTGKTTVARIVSRKLNAKLVHLAIFIKKHKLYESYDKKRKAMIVDVDNLRNTFSRIVGSHGENIVVDGHLSHFLDADVVFVLRLDPLKLRERLLRKRFSREKTAENVEAEILGIIYSEAMDLHGKTRKVVQIDTTGMSKNDVARLILNTLSHKKYRSDKVDWLEKYCRLLTEQKRRKSK